MSRYRITPGLAAVLFVAATGQYPVDWKSLEQAWNSYLAVPSAKTATSVQQLLPAGQHASHQVSDFDSAAATRILDRLGELQKLVANGELHAFQVAFALQDISDGEYSEWLSRMLGASARTHPIELLDALRANENRVSVSCEFGAAADPDRFDTTDKYRVEIAARRASVAAVQRHDLEKQKRCLLRVFDRALESS